MYLEQKCIVIFCGVIHTCSFHCAQMIVTDGNGFTRHWMMNDDCHLKRQTSFWNNFAIFEELGLKTWKSVLKIVPIVWLIHLCVRHKEGGNAQMPKALESWLSQGILLLWTTEWPRLIHLILPTTYCQILPLCWKATAHFSQIEAKGKYTQCFVCLYVFGWFVGQSVGRFTLIKIISASFWSMQFLHKPVFVLFCFLFVCFSFLSFFKLQY